MEVGHDKENENGVSAEFNIRGKNPWAPTQSQQAIHRDELETVITIRIHR